MTAETPRPASLRDRLLLRGLRVVFATLARHLMFLLGSHPTLADEWGYHVRPVHYYDPLPDFKTITPDATKRRRQSPAIEFNLPAQASLVRRLGAAYRAEVDALRASAVFDLHNEYFAGFDAAMYYALIRDLRPARIIEYRVWVHVHDIFFPHDYPAQWLIDRRIAFTEQYLLEAFLAFNRHFTIRAANHWLCLDHPDVVAELCPPALRPAGDLGFGSFWMQRIDGAGP